MKKMRIEFYGRKKLIQCLILPLLSLMLVTRLTTTPANATGVYDLPFVGAGQDVWVVDQAEDINLVTEGKLSNMLKNMAHHTGNELRMVVIRRLDYGETIDSFIDALFSKWFPTPEEQTNQTLIALDTLTNNSAIRSGLPKEIINNTLQKSIVEETIGAVLRDGNKYNQALLDAGDRLIAVLSGEPDPGPKVIRDRIQAESTFTDAEETDDRSATVWVVVLLIVATIIPMVTYFWYVGFPGR